MPSKDATEIHVLTIPVVQMLIVNLEMTPLCALVLQVMPVIHLIKDGVVKLSPAQLVHVVQMLNVPPMAELQFASVQEDTLVIPTLTAA